MAHDKLRCPPGARARRALGVIAGALLLTGCGVVNGKAPTESHSTVQFFERSCSAVWPELLHTIGQSGFKTMLSDKDAGIATFLWNGAQLPAVAGAGGDPSRLAQGSFSDWTTLRAESALLILKVKDRGCQASLAVTYKGRQGAFWDSDWTEVQSTGLLENRLLATILPAMARDRMCTRADQ